MRVRSIIVEQGSALQIMQFAARDLEILREQLETGGFTPSLVNLRGYGNVRNIQLIVSHILGAEVVIGLDDDEVVARDYLTVATECIDKMNNEEFAGGVTGFYLDGTQSNLVPRHSLING